MEGFLAVASTKPRLLDAYCGAGGCSVGYARAGFEVVGVDLHPQKNYPFEFHEGDALEFIVEHAHEFDVLAGSPPCQDHMRTPHKLHGTGWLLPATRAAFLESGLPYVSMSAPGTFAQTSSSAAASSASTSDASGGSRRTGTRWA